MDLHKSLTLGIAKASLPLFSLNRDFQKIYPLRILFAAGLTGFLRAATTCSATHP